MGYGEAGTYLSNQAATATTAATTCTRDAGGTTKEHNSDYGSSACLRVNDLDFGYFAAIAFNSRNPSTHLDLGSQHDTALVAGATSVCIAAATKAGN